jgi:hypothetical protein
VRNYKNIYNLGDKMGTEFWENIARKVEYYTVGKQLNWKGGGEWKLALM